MLDVSTPDRKATALLLLAIAGCVDAVGLAETGSYYVSFMSGNTTQAGTNLAYGYLDVRLWVPLGLVALFVGGVTAGALLAERAGRHAAGVLLLAEALLLVAAWYGFGTSRPVIGVALLPVAMGLANLVTLRGGGPNPGTTYATGALVKLGVALAGLGRDARGADVAFPLGMWLALCAGAALGAIERLRYGADVLLVPGVVLALLGLADLLVSRRRAG